MRPGSTRARLSAVPLAAVAVLAGGSDALAMTVQIPGREGDPVVVTGADTPRLSGAAPGRIVGFRFVRDRWKHVPVQIDERALVDYGAVRAFPPGTRPFSEVAYSDPDTLAGADPDPAFDADDELVAMAKDTGERARNVRPPRGVRARSLTEVRAADPLRKRRRGYLYLFRSKGKLDPAAGRSYVDYEFNLNSGDYRSTYDFDGVGNNGNGPPANTEDSSVTTPYYSQHLLSRWIEDELHITAGNSTGVDILDGDKFQVASSCGRSELTSSRGGGGFIANVSGPVRAIRSYIGANSGIYTQRDHIYYQRFDVSTTHLRVHAGVSDISLFYDYSPAAVGMTYRNSVNRGGVTIDGVPDAVAAGQPLWEQVSGPQGAATSITRVATDLPGHRVSNYYLDDSTDPPVAQCGGYADRLAFGASGSAMTSSGANTDPTLGSAYSLVGSRTTFYGKPTDDAGVAALRARQVDAPLRIRVR